MTPEEKNVYYAWRKATETDRRQCEVLGNHRRQTQEGGLELGLRISRGFQRANNLDC